LSDPNNLFFVGYGIGYGQREGQEGDPVYLNFDGTKKRIMGILVLGRRTEQHSSSGLPEERVITFGKLSGHSRTQTRIMGLSISEGGPIMTRVIIALTCPFFIRIKVFII